MTAVEYLINELSDIIGPIEATVSGELLMAGAIKRAKEMEKEQEEQYNNMLSMLQETYRRLEHTDMISLRKQIKEVLTFKSE